MSLIVINTKSAMKNYIIVFIGFLLILFTGCLTVEKKEYIIELTDGTSGTLTVKYYNIMSQPDDGKDVSLEDFGILVDDYLNGDKVNENFPNTTIISKELFEANGMLCGKVVLKFNALKYVKLYRHHVKGPYMWNIFNSFSEKVETTNGEYDEDKFSAIFWSENTKIFKISTIANENVEKNVSLLKKYQLTLPRSKTLTD